MKKFLKSLLLTILTVLPLAATAQFRIDIDNIDNVEFDLNGAPASYTLTDGKYVVEMNGERNLRVIAKKDVLLTEVTLIDDYANEESSWTNRVDVLGDGRYYIDLNTSFPEDEWFRIRTSASSDARSASCTVNVDDPSRVLLKRKGVEVELTKGDNTVKFDPATEAELEIEPIGKPLYRVSKGDTEYTTDYRYIVPIADGDVVTIQANYPDIDCPVKFILTGNGASDFITEVDVDGRPEFNWSAEDFSVKCGTELRLKGNTNEFEVLSFKINGHSAVFANPTTILVTDKAEIYIEVRKYASFVMTIDVDDPSHVKAYRGHASNGDLFELVAGKNTVEVTRNTPIVSFVPEDGFYVKTLDVNGDAYETEDLQISPIRVGSLVDNDVITLTTDIIVRDKKAMVYLENLEAAEGFFKLKRADLSEVEGLHEGYNELAFYDRDNRFRFETGGPVEAHFYINGSLEEPAPGGFNYTPVLAEGDVVKVYFGEAPALHTIRFNITGDIADKVKVVTDHISEASVADDLKVLHNSHIRISVPADAKTSVKLDNVDLTPESDGSYSFAATGDHTVDVNGSSGIDLLPSEEASGRIFNIHGISVDAPFETLPAGIYIIDGRKVIKR